MSGPSDPGASARRIALRAAMFVLPLVALAVAAPRVIERLRRSASPSAGLIARLQREAAPPGASAAAAGDGAVEGAAGRAAPPPGAGPTPEQIAKAAEAQEALRRAEKGWESVTLIAPRAAKRGEDGLETLPFQGFGVSVESVPEGARVIVGGEELGETPLVAGVRCAPGTEVTVRIEKAPRPAQERVLRCRPDTLVKLAVRLEAAGGR